MTRITTTLFVVFGIIFASASAFAEELLVTGEPSLAVQVLACDANGENCRARYFVAQPPAKQQAKAVATKSVSAKAIMDDVIAKAEAKRSINLLLAAANSDRNARPLDQPVQPVVATR